MHVFRAIASATPPPAAGKTDKLDRRVQAKVLRFNLWSGDQLLGTTNPNTKKSFAVLTDGNKNVIALLNQNGKITARYAYSPFGKLISAQGANAEECSFRFSSECLDTESGLVYYNYRYCSPQLGRCLSRDPIGNRGGYNLYGAANNDEINKWDVLGLLSPTTFWDDWTELDRKKWFTNFENKYKTNICRSAKRHCVPAELLAAILANEQIDYTWQEKLGERLGFGQSIRLGQITVQTAIDYGLTDCKLSDFKTKYIIGPSLSPVIITADEQFRQCVRERLSSDEVNIEDSARLIKQYLDKMCEQAKAGTFSNSFKQLSAGCDISDFCCRKSRDCESKDVLSCLISALAAAWNNGIGITQVKDISNKAPNAAAHAGNAGLIDGYLEGFCD